MSSFQHRPLGSTDLRVSALGLGTVKFGRNQEVKYPSAFDLPTDEQAKSLLKLAWDNGINFLDTAPAYGISEERLGHLLRGEREPWVISTKTGEEFADGKSWFDFSAQHTRHSVERSLRRLGRECLDLVLVHSDGNDVDIIENTDVFTELDRLKGQGLIKAYGMSTKTVEGGILAARESDCVMVAYNLDHTQERRVLDECLRLNKGVLLKKALASGHICHKSDQRDPIQASMDFIFAHPGVSSAIVGTINPQHLSDNIAKAKRSLA